jgi:hypothetical protein
MPGLSIIQKGWPSLGIPGARLGFPSIELVNEDGTGNVVDEWMALLRASSGCSSRSGGLDELKLWGDLLEPISARAEATTLTNRMLGPLSKILSPSTLVSKKNRHWDVSVATTKTAWH